MKVFNAKETIHFILKNQIVYGRKYNNHIRKDILFYISALILNIYEYYRNGYKFETAMILATLLGIFGIDRCYLGYITLGIFKFISCGGFIVWTLLDIILIASQILGPADGSSYEFISNVPRIRKLNIYNSTYWMP